MAASHRESRSGIFKRKYTSLVGTSNAQAHPDVEAQSESIASGYDISLKRLPQVPQDSLTHRDALGRLTPLPETECVEDNWCLDPNSAKLTQLLNLQKSTDLVSKVPWAIELAASAYKSDGKGELSTRWGIYVCSSILLPIALCTFSNLDTPIRNGGFYDRVLYHDWYPVHVAKNGMEALDHGCELDQEDSHANTKPLRDPRTKSPAIRVTELSNTRDNLGKVSRTPKRTSSDLQERILGPKRLCFVNGPRASEYPEYTPLEANQWQDRHPGMGFPSFLFVSYTSHQFVTQSREALDAAWTFGKIPEAEKNERILESVANRKALTRLAATVARERGLDAFWIDFESGIEHGVKSETDDPGAYAICDILRASTSMVIVVGPPYHYGKTNDGNDFNKFLTGRRNDWLASWGQRLWTLPELLFCPNKDGIAVHTLDGQPPETFSKHNIARTLEDGNSVRELVEHYNGTIQLSQLELIVTATTCLFARPYNTFSPGDTSYALMGLMRRRPRVNEMDSAFKAFARLSLLNDNDRLLERLICLQPDLSKHSPWYSMYDAYSASLWDIEPCTQVAGIIDAQPARGPGDCSKSIDPSRFDETQMIVLDGAFGASIKWESLDPVAFLKRPTGSEMFARFLVRGFPGWFLTGLAFTIAGASYHLLVCSMLGASGTCLKNPGAIAGGPYLGVGLTFLILCVMVMALLPRIIRRLYAGKLWSTQAAFFGVTGIPDLSQVERCLFGFNQDRLTWSTHSSTLSTAYIDPTTGELQPRRPDDPGHDEFSHLKTFTLIDTFTLTATVFEAERAPVAAIICGQEGGMQRALLCSYDPTTRTFCRETVLRMKTLCLERMPRMDRFRFAMRRG